MKNMMFVSMTDEQVDLRNALYDMTLNGASEDETYAIRKRMMELAGCSEEEMSANL